jgi:hypothetical protein
MDRRGRVQQREEDKNGDDGEIQIKNPVLFTQCV